jgi:unsaturated chondroitin disaccharide hydrolase
MSQPQTLFNKIQNAFEFAQDQVRRLVERYPDFYPMYTLNGRWKHSGESWTHWCDGFLPGMMWIFYERTGQEHWLERAVPYTRALEPRKYDRNVHDLGFLFWSTYKRWYDLTSDPILKEIMITAGQTLALRFKDKGGYLCSFIGPQSLFIDIMMNVGIIFYAAQQTSDSALLQKAHRHCLTTRRRLVRGDGSTAHEGIFDLETGEFLRQSTHQGWRGDSAWARGLAWSIYGFSTAHTLIQEPRYLATAQLCADFFLERTSFLPDAPFGPGVPPNDFDDPREPILPESSAAAIAASGLLDLANLVQDPSRRQAYRESALTILDTLTSPRYLSQGKPGWEGILMHGIYHLNKDLGVDESVMWGEYFFVEAMAKALVLLEQE